MMHFPEPGPELSPQEVIRTQLEALRHNDELGQNRGIEIAYDFASPTNKAATGPLDRFIQMVNNPLYHPMINFQQAKYGPMIREDDVAQQEVMLLTYDDELVGFLFTLSKQSEPPCKDWWMTDGVMRLY